MINKISNFALISVSVLALSSCGNSAKKDNNTDTTTVKTETTESAAPAKAENVPAGFDYTVTPDSAILGKTREAFVKVLSASSISLQDADGKSKGSEITFKIAVTNKSSLEDKKNFFLSSSDARLEMDNGQSVSSSNNTGDSAPVPEATTEAGWVFQLPPNAKPKKLNFFLDGTRVSVNLVQK